MNLKVFLEVHNRYYRDSLVALLLTLPGVEIIAGRNSTKTWDHKLMIGPDIIFVDQNALKPDQEALIRSYHLLWPQSKIVLLMDVSIQPVRSRLNDIDMILTVNTTAAEFLHSIHSLTNRQLDDLPISRLADSQVIPC